MNRNSPRPQSPAAKTVRHAWWLVALAGVALLIWINDARIDRVRYLSEVPSWSVNNPEIDPNSPTGYVNGQRGLIVPGHHNISFEWITLAQIGLEQGQWRIRHVDYDNAPEGRVSHATSPYRWYLTALAWAEHVFSERSLPLAVEYAALYADPLLQLVLLLSVAIFVARRFGALASCLAAVSVIAIFPLGGNFQAGAPDSHTLSWFCALWSVLPLLAGATQPAGRIDTRFSSQTAWFALAGVFAGLGMWVDDRSQGPVILGIVIGATVHSLLQPKPNRGHLADRLPWRAWAIVGAVTCLVGYAFEYVPSHMEWSIHAIHPLHALALLGLGELLVRFAGWRHYGRSAWNAPAIVTTALAFIAVSALPLTAWLTESGGDFGNDPFASQLANHPAGTFASDVGSWIRRDGLNLSVWAAILPVVVLLLALATVMYSKAGSQLRSTIALVSGPALAALVLAFVQLRWWSMFDVLLIPVVIALFQRGAFPVESPKRRWAAAIAYLALLTPGFLLTARENRHPERDLNAQEVQLALERDLAYWLVQQSHPEKPVVLSTPAVSETLQFYGGIPVVSSSKRENESGFSAATRISSATSWAEAHILLTGREISDIVVPAWDPAFELYIRLGRHTPNDAPLPEDSFVGDIMHWNLPPWLSPVPYSIPKKPGFEGFLARVYSLTPPQDEINAACRLADYFLESGMIREATVIREDLSQYPRSLAALTMQAHISYALRDAANFNKALETLVPYLSRRSARNLPFDRRVSLTVLLVQAKRIPEAREQMRLVMEELDLERFRELTTAARIRVLAMSGLLKVDFRDSQLREQLIDLVPPGIQEKLQKDA